MLGVRREGVTEGALKLQKAGLISYCARPHHGAGPRRARGAQLRVLRGREEGIRPPAAGPSGHLRASSRGMWPENEQIVVPVCAGRQCAGRGGTRLAGLHRFQHRQRPLSTRVGRPEPSHRAARPQGSRTPARLVRTGRADVCQRAVRARRENPVRVFPGRRLRFAADPDRRKSGARSGDGGSRGHAWCAARHGRHDSASARARARLGLGLAPGRESVQQELAQSAACASF